MSDTTLTVNSARFTAALTRLVGTSKRGADEIMRQRAKLVVADVARITPPASEGKFGRAAETQGKAAVAGDINSVYGTPGEAYEAIAGSAPSAASAFWVLHRSGDDAAAGKIVYDQLGRSFSPFDGGTAHRRVLGRRAEIDRRRKAVFYVHNPEALAAYIAKEQEHVWWLASGWAPALRELGGRAPYGVGKLPAPGAVLVTSSATGIEIRLVNRVAFAGGVKGIRRRLDWAVARSADNMDKMWKFYLARMAGEAGIKSKP